MTQPGLGAELDPGWWARLEGDSLDLEDLEGVALDGHHTAQASGHHYLRLADLTGPEDRSEELLHLARSLVHLLNGAAKLVHSNSREVTVDHVLRVNQDRSTLSFVRAEGLITARGRMKASLMIDGEPVELEQDAGLVTRLATAALNHEEAERALRIFGRGDCDYRDLYHVYEIARSGLRGNLARRERGISDSDLTRFKRTAQSPTVLGDVARHGVDRQTPPSDPMSFEEAHQLVRSLLLAWLDQLSSHEGRPNDE